MSKITWNHEADTMSEAIGQDMQGLIEGIGERLADTVKGPSDIDKIDIKLSEVERAAMCMQVVGGNPSTGILVIAMTGGDITVDQRPSEIAELLAASDVSDNAIVTMFVYKQMERQNPMAEMLAAMGKDSE